MKRIMVTGLAPLLLIALATASCSDSKGPNEAAGVATPILDGAPTADGAHLRVEVVDKDAAVCDGQPREVRVWLDSLPPNPTALPTEPPLYVIPGTPRPTPVAAAGVGGVEFTLTFDPAIVWLRESADASLGKDLASAGPGGSPGSYFLAPVRFDNYAGTITAGAVKLGGAPGVDPAAAGKPLQLLTVGMLPVGKGITALKLTGVRLFADSAYGYEPIVAADAAMTVSGDCPSVVTPTPQPEPSPAVTAIATPSAPVTPVFVTPLADAAAGARSDCPAGWVTFADIGKSLTVCSPPGLFATSVVSPEGASAITIASVLNGRSNPNVPRVALSAGLQSSPGLSQLPAAERCSHGGVPGQVSAEPIDVMVAGQLVGGCHYVGETYSPDGPLESITASLALRAPQAGSPAFLSVTVNWRTNSPGAQSLAKQMLAEVRPSG